MNALLKGGLNVCRIRNDATLRLGAVSAVPTMRCRYQLLFAAQTVARRACHTGCVASVATTVAARC